LLTADGEDGVLVESVAEVNGLRTLHPRDEGAALGLPLPGVGILPPPRRFNVGDVILLQVLEERLCERIVLALRQVTLAGGHDGELRKAYALRARGCALDVLKDRSRRRRHLRPESLDFGHPNAHRHRAGAENGMAGGIQGAHLLCSLLPEANGIVEGTCEALQGI